MIAIAGEPLTSKQQAILNVLAEPTEQRPPTHERIAELAKLPSRGGVGKQLKALQRKINPETGKPYIDEFYRPIE